jgi:putative ATP-dependent endonuclease of the OLD family
MAKTKSPTGAQAGATATQMPSRAALILKDLRVQDFRGLSDLCTTFESLTVLVGENNAGKTSLLQALAVAFGPTRPTRDDFAVGSNGVRASLFVIDVRLTPAKGTDFDSGLKARFRGAIQFPDSTCNTEYVAMRVIGQEDLTGSLTVDRAFLKGWGSTRAEAAKVQPLPDLVHSQHLELVAFFLLDAKRDLVDELRNRASHWGRLISELEIVAAAKAAIEKQLDDLGREIIKSSPLLSAVRGELQNVRDALSNSISDVEIAPLPGRIDELARGIDVVLTAPSGSTLPMRVHGQGARSLAAVMVFKSFIQRRVGVTQTFRPLVIAAFEEPEAHLHPQAHRAMFHLIKDLDAQRIVSTHSPYVLRVVEDLHAIRLLGRLHTGLVKCNSVPRSTGGKPTFTVEEIAQLRKFVLRNNGEAIFARMVVIVEGDTEDAALPVFAENHWGRDHTAYGITIARTDGGQSGKHVVKLLEALGVPWIVFADGDLAGQGGLAGIQSAIGRPLKPNEFVQLPNNTSIEGYLVDEGYRLAMESAVDDGMGAGVLKKWGDDHHGMKKSKSETRDYKSQGWEERLIRDYCAHHKGTFGAQLAIGIIKHCTKSNRPPTPPAIATLFSKIESLLGIKQP